MCPAGEVWAQSSTCTFGNSSKESQRRPWLRWGGGAVTIHTLLCITALCPPGIVKTPPGMLLPYHQSSEVNWRGVETVLSVSLSGQASRGCQAGSRVEFQSQWIGVSKRRLAIHTSRYTSSVACWFKSPRQQYVGLWLIYTAHSDKLRSLHSSGNPSVTAQL